MKRMSRKIVAAMLIFGIIGEPGVKGKEILKIISVQKKVIWTSSKSIGGSKLSGGHYGFKLIVRTNKPATCRIKWFRDFGWDLYTGGKRNDPTLAKKHIFSCGTLKPDSEIYVEIKARAGTESAGKEITLLVPSRPNGKDAIYDVVLKWSLDKLEVGRKGYLRLLWGLDSDNPGLSLYTSYFKRSDQSYWNRFLCLDTDGVYFWGKPEDLDVKAGQTWDFLITGVSNNNAALKFSVTIRGEKGVGFYSP